MSLPLLRSAARLLVVAAAISVTLLGCASQPKDRAELLALLVKKGDENPKTAWYPYSLAVRFAPQDQAIDAKFNGAGGWKAARRYTTAINDDGLLGENFNEIMKRTGEVVGACSTSDLQAAFPTPTAEMELTNLKMLMDEKLVGDLRYTSLAGQEVESKQPFAVFLFLANPGRTTEDIVKIHGEPQEKRSNSVLTYGRIRIIGDKAGQVIGVVHLFQ
jgi:hypothetical protein